MFNLFWAFERAKNNYESVGKSIQSLTADDIIPFGHNNGQKAADSQYGTINTPRELSPLNLLKC